MLWLGGYSGIQYFDPLSGSLTDYTPELRKFGFNGSVNRIAFAPDNSLWIGSSTRNEIYHLITDPGSDQTTLRSYDSRDGLPEGLSQDDKVDALAFAPDGSIWISTQEYATHCLFSQ